jgi:GNAT superfamily N-acetyltransferase
MAEKKKRKARLTPRPPARLLATKSKGVDQERASPTAKRAGSGEGEQAQGGTGELDIHPLTPERWGDLEALFGPQGAVKGCWCMWWRFTPREYEAAAPAARREAFQAVVAGGGTPGLLAYAGGRPVGWCAVAPREQFPRIRTATTWRPIDSVPVWSIVCYYIAAEARRQQVASRLLAAAVDYARAQGAEVIEAYPKDTEVMPGPHPDERLHFGTLSMYRAAGFEEVARRNPAFPIMRLKVR